MTIGKKINTPYGKLDLKIYSYENNGRLAILLYDKDGELFDELTINLSNNMISDIDEGFINADIDMLTTDNFNMIDALIDLGIIVYDFGKVCYNMGRYNYVKFNLDKLKEYDIDGYNQFMNV